MKQEMELYCRLSRFFAQDASRLRLVLVYLFGSQAEGRGGPISDYDFAILFAQEPAARESYSLQHRLTQLLGMDRVDLVVLNHAPIELKYSVIVTGNLLYEADRAQRVEFEAQTLSRYFDYLPVLRCQRRELLEEDDHDTRIQRYRAALRETQRVLTQVRTA